MMENYLYRIIGGNIHRLRKKKGLTQVEVAENIGLARTSLTNFETGKQRAPLHILYRICEALKCEITDILPLLSEKDKWPEMVAELGSERSLISELHAMSERIKELERALEKKSDKEE